MGEMEKPDFDNEDRDFTLGDLHNSVMPCPEISLLQFLHHSHLECELCTSKHLLSEIQFNEHLKEAVIFLKRDFVRTRAERFPLICSQPKLETL